MSQAPSDGQFFELAGDLPPELYPLAGFVGRWRGHGSVGYPGIDQSGIVQEVTIEQGGGPYLAYRATTWLVDDSGEVGAEWHSETGYWRITPTPDQQLDPPFAVEFVIADAAGYVTVYVGEVNGARLTVASDVIARTSSAAEVAAGRRMYGIVEGDLLWAWDIAAFGNELGSYMAARLPRIKG
ncbi:MAG: FABP family protein [Bifidobacteriaceae bacterium]|jgi:hypothetical protein|nr:FABP family protein [Bifidobacteriaceae bacterium]